MNTKRRLIDLVKGVEGVRQIWRIIEEYEKPYPHCSRKLNSENTVTTAGCQTFHIRDGRKECRRGQRPAGNQGVGWSDADTLLAKPRLRLVFATTSAVRDSRFSRLLF